MNFCKTLLGVQKQASNIRTVLELGAVPILFFVVKSCLKNWHRIHRIHEANNILLKVHHIGGEHNLPWPVLNKHYLDSTGIGFDSKVNNIHGATFVKIEETFLKHSFE